MADQRRALALKILIEGEKHPRHPIDSFLGRAIDIESLSSADRAWITEVVLGTTRWRRRLDHEIQTKFKGKLQKAQHALRAALRMGLYQLRFMDTPSHAALNATVESAKAHLPKSPIGMLNGVLRSLDRDPGDYETGTINPQPLEDLAIKTSHPSWLVKRWAQHYGLDETRQFCSFNNARPSNWIRVNGSRIKPADFQARLADMGISVKQAAQSEHSLQVDDLSRLLRSEPYTEGLFWVQDLAASLVPELVPVKPGDTVLDLCAAPGGKTAVLADLYADQATIIASDVNPQRLRRVRSNLKRLHFDSISTRELDATADEIPRANAILLDVPCSGTGVLHRRADSRWNKTAADITSLAELQLVILDRAWEALEPGGTLVYSTCTLESEENWEQIDLALERHSNMSIHPVDNPRLTDYVDERGAFAPLPWKHGLDGMFAVCLRKA